jgi:hypothetical protein
VDGYGERAVWIVAFNPDRDPQAFTPCPLGQLPHLCFATVERVAACDPRLDAWRMRVRLTPPSPALGQTPIRNHLLLAGLNMDERIQDPDTSSFAIATAPQQPAVNTYYLPPDLAEKVALRGLGRRPWRPVRLGVTQDREPRIWDARIAYPREDSLFGGVDLPHSNVAAVFPLPPRGVGLEITPSLRVEPLSTERDPAWDTVVCLGRLDTLERSDIERLSRAEDPLLRLAAAYACYANHFDEELGALVVDLLDTPSLLYRVDAVILWHAAGMARVNIASVSTTGIPRLTC